MRWRLANRTAVKALTAVAILLCLLLLLIGSGPYQDIAALGRSSAAIVADPCGKAMLSPPANDQEEEPMGNPSRTERAKQTARETGLRWKNGLVETWVDAPERARQIAEETYGTWRDYPAERWEKERGVSVTNKLWTYCAE